MSDDTEQKPEVSDDLEERKWVRVSRVDLTGVFRDPDAAPLVLTFPRVMTLEERERVADFVMLAIMEGEH